jgi:hypothetical protein
MRSMSGEKARDMPAHRRRKLSYAVGLSEGVRPRSAATARDIPWIRENARRDHG